MHMGKFCKVIQPCQHGCNLIKWVGVCTPDIGNGGKGVESSSL